MNPQEGKNGDWDKEKCNTKKTNSKMVESIITLNVNGLNTPNKEQKLSTEKERYCHRHLVRETL